MSRAGTPPETHKRQIDAFAQSYLVHGEYLRAWRASHPESKSKNKVTASHQGKAYYLKHKTTIDARMAELSAQSSQLTTEITLEKLKKAVNTVLDNKGAKDSDLLKAVEVAARLLGLNAPDKSEVVTNLSLTQLISDFSLPASAPPKAISTDAPIPAQIIDIQPVTAQNEADKSVIGQDAITPNPA